MVNGSFINVIKQICSLSNSRRHSANADVIFSGTSKDQKYQNKTGEKDLYPSKCVLTT